MVYESVAQDTKVRTKCPFYGFAYVNGIFMDSEGNQCALITDSYSPCQMEMKSKNVCWVDCGFNSEDKSSTIEKILDGATIFPNELKPKVAKSWEGIPFRSWYEHIVDGKKI